MARAVIRNVVMLGECRTVRILDYRRTLIVQGTSGPPYSIRIFEDPNFPCELYQRREVASSTPTGRLQVSTQLNS